MKVPLWLVLNVGFWDAAARSSYWNISLVPPLTPGYDSATRSSSSKMGMYEYANSSTSPPVSRLHRSAPSPAALQRRLYTRWYSKTLTQMGIHNAPSAPCWNKSLSTLHHHKRKSLSHPCSLGMGTWQKTKQAERKKCCKNEPLLQIALLMVFLLHM